MLNLPKTMAKKNKKGKEQGQMSVVHHRKWLWLLNLRIKDDNKKGKGIFFTACKRHLAYLYIKIGRYYAKNLQHNGHVSTSQALYG